MFLLRVIPATKIPLNSPQVLTYFSTRELPTGSLVLVPLHKRNVVGVVESSEKIDGQKMTLRKAEFELRGIAKVISDELILDKKQLQLAKWMNEYYWCPIGAIIKLMIPTRISARGGKNSELRIKNYAAKNEKQTLILVPETSLISPSLIRRGLGGGQNNTIYLHSNLTDKQYYENWLKIKNGEARTIIGTRMALFAPFQNLKEIIIEEEHNDLYKSRQTPRYHARETALKLAEIWGAKITLKSPTPSVEASWLAENKKTILQKAAISHQPSATGIIDLRQELKDGNFSIFSRKLQESIKSALEKKQQIILFINRRGASTALLCRDCGYVPKCQNCEAPMAYHLAPIQFLCHHCGHSEIPPVLCPSCLGTRIKYFGAGTQKTEAEFKKLFPEVKVARFDSDVIKSVEAGQKIIEDFNNKKIQALIGTQIIFNKGLSKAPLAAMMIADTFLYRPDFRSNEKTFQIISQLKSLSKREFILQTYSPENMAIQTAVKNGYEPFYKQEIKDRHELNYPPFSQLIKLTYQHKSAKKAEEEAKILTEKIKQQIAVHKKQLTAADKKSNSVNLHPLTILGPSPAFISKSKGKYIWQIILKSKIADLKLRNQILKIIPPDWIVDVDPIQII